MDSVQSIRPFRLVVDMMAGDDGSALEVGRNGQSDQDSEGLLRRSSCRALLGQKPQNEETQKMKEEQLGDGFAEREALAQVVHGEQTFEGELDEEDELRETSCQFLADSQFRAASQKDERKDGHHAPWVEGGKHIAQVGREEGQHQANRDGPGYACEVWLRQIIFMLRGTVTGIGMRASLHTGRLTAHLGIGDCAMRIRHIFFRWAGEIRKHRYFALSEEQNARHF